MRLSAGEYFRTNERSVVVEPRSPQSPFPEHDHEFKELFIVLSGNGWHVINDVPHFVTCGELFYIEPDDRHEFVDVNDLFLVNILYRRDGAFFEELDQVLDPPRAGDGERRHWQITEDTLGQVRPLIERMEGEARGDDPTCRIMTQTLFAQLRVMLRRERFASDDAELPRATRLIHALNYLRKHCVEEVDLDDVAKRFGYSTRNFNRVFRDATSTTPHNYLVKLRLGEAMRLLRKSEAGVTDIAFAAGFNDSNYFSYAFSKSTGMSPTEYRRRHVARSRGADMDVAKDRAP